METLVEEELAVEVLVEETLEVAKQDHHHQAEQEAVVEEMVEEVAARQAEVKRPEELDN